MIYGLKLLCFFQNSLNSTILGFFYSIVIWKIKLRQTIKLLATLLMLVSTATYAVEYDCAVDNRITADKQYSQKDIVANKYSISAFVINDTKGISTCYLSKEKNRVLCDTWPVDTVEFNESLKMKKFYAFRGQADLQILKDMSYVFNNGQGEISFGKCKVTSP